MRIRNVMGLALSALGFAGSLASVGSGAEDAPREGAVAPEARGRALLEEALGIRYDCDVSARLRLVMTDRGGARRVRELEILTMQRGGRLHALGRVLSPEHLRGLTLLSIEAEDRADDTFVYLPSLGRARRISGSRRGDAFLGSDLTYQDLERHRARDYQVLDAVSVAQGDERALRVVTRPVDSEVGSRVDFVVARADRALLAVSYYRAGPEPVRSLSVPRRAIRRFGPNLVPTRMEVSHPARGTHTVVEVLDLQVNPAIDPRIFSVGALEAERSLEPSARP